MKNVLILFILLFILACGTETGNPLEPEPASNTEARVLTNSYKALEELCKRIESCYGLAQSTCLQEALDEDGFDLAFNLGSSTYSNLDQIINAEVENTLVVQDETAAGQCITDISTLSCGSTEITNAYSLASPTDYSNLSLGIPVRANSCQSIY